MGAEKSGNFFVHLLGRLTLPHYIVLVLVLGIGVFNAVTGLSPYLKQLERENNIESTFDQWWKDVGAEQFRSIGLEPTEKIRNEEFESYREKYLAQNHSIVIEERVEEIKAEFLELWENGGAKEQFAREHDRYPDNQDYQRLLDQKIQNYTQQFIRYNMAFIPKQGNYGNLLTSWILSPSIFSYLIFAPFFVFAFIQLRMRWKFLLFLGMTAAAVICGGILVDILSGTSMLSAHLGERYMGMSLAMAFLLGAVAFGPKNLGIPQWVTGACVFGLMGDIAINWLVHPGLYKAVSVLDPILFGLGALAGIKIETRRKTVNEQISEAREERLRKNAERNPMAERKSKTRSSIEEGFHAAKEGMNEKAQRILGQAFNALLQEHPVDTATIKSLTQRITSPSLYVDFTSTQWLEWGEIAKSKNAPEAAILLLKKGLSLEKDPHFARRALFILGDICVNNKMEYQDGINRLKKVIEMNENDMMAKQARRMLEHIQPAEEDKKENKEEVKEVSKEEKPADTEKAD